MTGLTGGAGAQQTLKWHREGTAVGAVCVCVQRACCAGDTNTNDVCGQQHSHQQSNGILSTSETIMFEEPAVKLKSTPSKVHYVAVGVYL